MFGQLANWNKLNIFFGQSILAARQQYLLNFIGMRRDKFSFVYLVLPLFKGKPKSVHLLPIVDRIHAQSNSWKCSILSLARRVCLVDSVIPSRFVHAFMIYRWTSDLLSTLNKSIQNFISTSSIFLHKIVIVAWDKCCLPLKLGGLGLKNLAFLNRALIAKFTWKFMSQNSFVYRFCLLVI